MPFILLSFPYPFKKLYFLETHGIRVVSKYSRSKAFDFGKNSNKSSTEQQLTIDDVIMDVRADDDNCSSEMTTNIVDNNDDDNMMTNSNNNNKIGRKVRVKKDFYWEGEMQADLVYTTPSLTSPSPSYPISISEIFLLKRCYM